MFFYCKNNPINRKDEHGFMSSMFSEDCGSGTYGDFSYIDSAVKGSKSGAIDEIGEVAGGTFIKEKKVWQSFETLTLGKYTSNLGKGAKFGKKALGVAGTVGFALWDVGNDLIKGEYYSAAIDVASAFVGFGAFVATVGIGVVIDKYATYRKDAYYGR